MNHETFEYINTTGNDMLWGETEGFFTKLFENADLSKLTPNAKIEIIGDYPRNAYPRTGYKNPIFRYAEYIPEEIIPGYHRFIHLKFVCVMKDIILSIEFVNYYINPSQYWTTVLSQGGDQTQFSNQVTCPNGFKAILHY